MTLLDRVRETLVADGSLRGRKVALRSESAALRDVLAAAGAELADDAPDVAIDDRGVTRAAGRIETSDARCVRVFDGESTVLAVAEATNLLIAGKRVVCVDYAVAKKARGLGAVVTVCAPDALTAFEAHHAGFEIAPLAEACAHAEIAIGALDSHAIAALPDGAIVAHDAPLDLRAVEIRRAREHVSEHVLADGRSLFLVDVAACARRPAEAEELVVALQVLSARYLLLHGAPHESMPLEIDEAVARMQLDALR